MSTVLDNVVDVQDKVVETLGQIKEPMVNAAENVTKFVGEKAESALRPVPYADRLPTPEELIKAEYSFVGNLLDTTKDISLAVASATAPVTNRLLDRKPSPAKARSTKAKATTTKAKARSAA